MTSKINHPVKKTKKLQTNNAQFPHENSRIYLVKSHTSEKIKGIKLIKKHEKVPGFMSRRWGRDGLSMGKGEAAGGRKPGHDLLNVTLVSSREIGRGRG